MGTTLHITRNQHWPTAGGQVITRAEWCDLVATHPKLRSAPEVSPSAAAFDDGDDGESWIDWDDGDLEAPFREGMSPELILDVASQLDAIVLDDDGLEFGRPRRAPNERGWQRNIAWDGLRALFYRFLPARPAEIPFQVGDKVIDVLGRRARILHVDPRADHGLGRIKVHYEDGRQAEFAGEASGLMADDS